jgi:hypothetical protein
MPSIFTLEGIHPVRSTGVPGSHAPILAFLRSQNEMRALQLQGLGLDPVRSTGVPGSAPPILSLHRTDLELCRETTGAPIYLADAGMGMGMGDVTAFLDRQGYVVGGLIALAMSLAIGGVVSIVIVKGLQTVGALNPKALSGSSKRRRRKKRS